MFQPFEQERMMSKWENVVAYNLAESGVHPATVYDLTEDPAVIEELLTTELNYVQANGIDRTPGAHRGPLSWRNARSPAGHRRLRRGQLYHFAHSPGTWGRDGDDAAQLPAGMGHRPELRSPGQGLPPEAEQGWAPDLDELEAAVSDQTKLIAVCNPNNPTGYTLTEAEMDAVVAAAERVGAWLLADEVYSGAERLTDTRTPSFWGRYDRVLATNSLSKAYGLPGLRIGWLVGPPDVVDEAWARHEYTTIGTTMLSNKLAALALSPQVRPRLIQRTRDYIRRGFPILEEWLDSHEGVFDLIPPQAAAIAFARYHLDINSTELAKRLIHDKSVLIVPGDHFGLDHYLRISYGVPPDYLRAGLSRIHELIVELQG